MTLRLFSFGYAGWGNATQVLVQAVDAVERERGFLPPIFVDTRIRRSVRAAGFQGSTFEQFLGAERHVWLRRLGNLRILSRSGPEFQIADPSAVDDLLTLAEQAADARRRVIFFCSCRWARIQGRTACHREVVADLAVAAAKRAKRSVEILEWPGEELGELKIELSMPVFKTMRQGAAYLPADKLPVEKVAAIAGGTLLTVRSGNVTAHPIVGPARYLAGRWKLPVLLADAGSRSELQRENATAIRQAYGFELRHS